MDKSLGIVVILQNGDTKKLIVNEAPFDVPEITEVILNIGEETISLTHYDESGVITLTAHGVTIGIDAVK